MASVRSRENTFKIDLSNFPKRPSFEEIHSFVHKTLGLTVEHVTRLQMNHAQNCAHVKCRDLQCALDVVENHHEKHELEVNKTKVKVRLFMDDGGVEVKIHDLSENIRNEEIVAFLKQYGDVSSIKEMIWGENFDLKGIPSGVRVAKMTLRRHIKSFVTIQGEQTLVTYRNQPQTCKHCTNPSHPGSSCVENKKLLGQKVDLNNRLIQAAQATGNPSTSFADVVGKNTISAPTLLSKFVTLNSSRSNPAIAPDNNNASVSHSSAQLLNATTIPSEQTKEHLVTQVPQSSTPDVRAAQLENTKRDEATMSSVSTFKPPSSVPNPKNFSMEISDSESCASSRENEPFRTVRRSRRNKKQKIDSPNDPTKHQHPEQSSPANPE